MNLKELFTKTRMGFLLGLIATTVVTKFETAMAAIAALTASAIGFTGTGAEGNGFASATDNVEKALIELMQKANGADVNFEKLNTPNAGKLATYRFTKGTGATAQSMDIDLEKDLMRAIVGFVTITEGEGADAGKYFDGQTEVGAADGVTGAGIYLKSNEVDASGSATGTVKYADASAVIEYITIGNQTGKVVTLTLDPETHQLTADIADGAIGKAKLDASVQASLDAADSALQEDDLDQVTEADCTTLWNTAMTSAQTAWDNEHNA